MRNLSKKYKRGYTLIEILFYISIFVILSFVVINALIIMTKIFRESNLQADIIQSSNIMERMSREIKQSSSIFNLSSNDITIMVPDEVDALIRPVRFVLSGGNLELYDNGVLIGNLNSSDVGVENLTFTQITTANGSAVKITLAVSANDDLLNRVYYFYNTLALRGDY